MPSNTTTIVATLTLALGLIAVAMSGGGVLTEVSAQTGTSTPIELVTVAQTYPIGTISERLVGMSQSEKENTKGAEMDKIVNLPRQTVTFSGKTYDIEIMSTTAVIGGVQVLARAWSNGKRVGFGTDGSVEIERFVITNPPILVADPTGLITSSDGKKQYREDPQQALLQSIMYTISAMKQARTDTAITNGKIGNTTYTFYSSAGAVSPVDGYVRLNFGAGTNNTWTTLRDGATGGLAGVSDTSQNAYTVISDSGANGWRVMQRQYYLFDTATIPDGDTIVSASISFFGVSKTDTLVMTATQSNFHVATSAPASNSSLVTADYNKIGRLSFGSTPYSTFSVTNYNPVTLNATGIANISKTSLSKFSSQSGADILNSTPTWGATLSTEISVYLADNTGTTNDPVLVVESGVPTTNSYLRINGGAQVVNGGIIVIN